MRPNKTIKNLHEGKTRSLIGDSKLNKLGINRKKVNSTSTGRSSPRSIHSNMSKGLNPSNTTRNFGSPAPSLPQTTQITPRKENKHKKKK